MDDREDAPAEGLVQLRVELPDQVDPREESLWAEPLGGDRYQLRTTPWYAHDLHLEDVVRAVSQAPGDWPTIQEVVESSGHQTLWVRFQDEVDETTVQQVLQRLAEAAVRAEANRGRLYALDVWPEGDFAGVCTYLWFLEQEGLLSYETGASPNQFPPQQIHPLL
jgi:hypothetical protein